MDLAGRVAIVTGAASGIGRAAAQVLAEAGAAAVAIADIQAEGARETCARLESSTRTKGLVVQTDVVEEAQVEHLVQTTLDQFGQVDILVNNAGICPMATWDEATLDKFLTKPKKMIKKTKMAFSGLKKEKQRADLIAYLKANGG